MLFSGEYEFTIDAKNRLAIPAVIRGRLEAEQHGPGLYAVPGPNGALWLWPERTFEQLAGALDPSLLPAEELLEYEELLFPQASRVEMDGAGRVRLPERLLKLSGIGKRVVILGMRDRLELRDPDEWAARLEEKIAKRGEIMLKARKTLADLQRRKQDGGGT